MEAFFPNHDRNRIPKQSAAFLSDYGPGEEKAPEDQVESPFLNGTCCFAEEGDPENKDHLPLQGFGLDGKTEPDWKAFPTYDDSEEVTLQDKLFKIRGRLNRKPYLLRSIAISLTVLLIIVIAEQLMPYSTDDALRSASESGQILTGRDNLFVLLFQGLANFAGITLNIRRCHDLGKSGWFLLWTLLPPGYIYVMFRLIFSRGEKGPNRFGPDPLARIQN
jgi:uncharacterized membrane protein YhaH (DUF805 family)